MKDISIETQAEVFSQAALQMLRIDGSFMEGGGSDTSYQAVSLVAMSDLIGLSQETEPRTMIYESWQKGVVWLSDKITKEGHLDSSQNARTCAQEDFLGRDKKADLREVFRALSYAQAIEQRKIENFSKFKDWILTVPDPCKV